ncbi:PD-(D/E)XK nuclease family protein [Xanthobacter sediminis]
MNERAAVEERASRLSRFLKEYRDARAPGAGLVRFLDQFRRLNEFRSHLPSPLRSPPDPATWSAFFNGLHDACCAARADDRMTNIWAIAGLKRNEVRTTSVLAWALDHRQDHGFGDAVLRALFERFAEQLPADIQLGANYRVRTEYCAFGAQEDRIDIAIEGENYIIFIEAKIDAPEGAQQIERYLRKAKDRAQHTRKSAWCVLYLSESSPAIQATGVVRILWHDIADAIEVAVKRRPGPESFSSHALQHFATHVRQLHGGRHVITRA